MKKNIGKTDMTVRLVLAALLVILYFFVGKIFLTSCISGKYSFVLHLRYG